MAKFDEHQKKINRMINKRIIQGERNVAKFYAKMLSEIRLLLAKIFEKYENGGKLTWEDMAKYDRFNKMMSEIQWTLKTHYKGIAKIILEIISSLYDETHNLFAYGVEQEVKSKLAYSTASPEQLLAAVTNPVTKLSPKLWADNDRGTLVYRIQQTITQGLANGSTYSTMAKELKKEVGGGAYRAMRVVRTEGHRVSEKAKHDAAKHADKQGIIMLKTWNSLQDERVRDGIANHRHLDGKTIPMDELFDDGMSEGPGPGLLPAPGSSINCRCFMTYEVDKIERKQHEVLTDMSFEEWKKTRLIKR